MRVSPTRFFLSVAIICLAALLLCGGCATNNIPVPVNVAVPVKCKAVEPDRPVMPTEQLESNSATLDEIVQGAMAEIELREGYEERLRTALRSCK